VYFVKEFFKSLHAMLDFISFTEVFSIQGLISGSPRVQIPEKPFLTNYIGFIVSVSVI
jgi:hypothetical protein